MCSRACVFQEPELLPSLSMARTSSRIFNPPLRIRTQEFKAHPPRPPHSRPNHSSSRTDSSRSAVSPVTHNPDNPPNTNLDIQSTDAVSVSVQTAGEPGPEELRCALAQTIAKLNAVCGNAPSLLNFVVSNGRCLIASRSAVG